MRGSDGLYVFSLRQIAALFQHLTIAEQEHNDIDQLLSHIEQQQRELGSTLDVYERSAKDLFQGQSGNLRALDVGPADAERDKKYVFITKSTFSYINLN